MADEFRRYRLEQFRVLIGVLEIAGGIGLAAGFYFPWLTLLASLGLSILMVMGALVRARLRDSLGQMLPAIFFFAISFFVFVSELKLIL